MSTAWTMRPSDLAVDATVSDLLRFRAACAAYRAEHPGISDEDATDVVWGTGDCWERVLELTPDWVEGLGHDAR